MFDNSEEITRLLPFFYPSSQSTTPDPISTAASLANHLKAKPNVTALLATDLPTFILHIAVTHPAHIDHVLQTVYILIKTPSLPLVNNWSFRPNATIEEMFRAAFKEDVNDAFLDPLEISEREWHIGASLLAARSRSTGILTTPEIVGVMAEGLGFPDEADFNYQGEAAEIAATGSCIQLLCGASSLVQDMPERFAKDKILAALDDLQFGQIDTLIKFTKSHLEKEPLMDLTSEEVVDGLKELGWRFPGDRY